MSKKSPGMGKDQKTLFSFFQKSNGPPKPEITPIKKESKNAIPSSDETTPITPKAHAPQSSPTRKVRPSRRMLILDSSDSEDEAAKDIEDSDDDYGKQADKNGADDDDDDDDDFMDVEDEATLAEVTPKKRAKAPKTPSKVQRNLLSSDLNSSPSKAATSSALPSSPMSAAESLRKFSKYSDYTPEPQSSPASHRGQLPLTKKVKVTEDPDRYKWLLNIKDADGKSPDDPDYDPRTIFIPQSAWAKFTPFEKQYWEVKQNLWNTVVFFKKGKFYELYENDAAIAHQQFDLKLAGGGRANMSLCGVPEMSFDYWASAFIAKGHKVARVDQSETALGKEMRDMANKKKEDKIIKRELSFVLTGGTLTDASMLVSDLSQYCMTIKQDGLDFAACFVDTASSQFYVARFTDKSDDYPLLETLMAQIRPKELVLARGNLAKYAVKIIKNNTSMDTLWETVKLDSEFWDAETTRRVFDLDDYFTADDRPEFLEKALQDDLSASAIGALVWYLRTLKLDKQLIGLGQFHEYNSQLSLSGVASTMVLDGQTLQNLEVFANSWDGRSEGTLFSLINKCITPFGKRRLRSWIIHPLRNPKDIAARTDAIEMFMEQDEVAGALTSKLVSLPDTERMLSRVHAGALKPKDFVSLVAGLETMARTLTWINGLKSQLPQLIPFLGGVNDELEKAIEPWMTSFDHVQAKENNKLIPEKGLDEEFDQRSQEVEEAKRDLEELLKVYRKDFNSNLLEFRDSGKEIYLIEVPAKLVKLVPRDWQQMGATAKFKRYWSPEGKILVRTLQEAQERLNIASVACQHNIYEKFCTPKNYELFMEATRVISALDCLLSLSKTSNNMAVHCRPTILDPDSNNTKPVIEFTDLRHPVATSTDFIPNDISLGGDGARLSLLTGANAAGKSTVLRTTCSAVLLAQLGCHVPAKTAKLTPVDRIMTRLGASDNIFAGKSTFHMELAETERILSESSPNSLIVIDELGRGGSSSDGFAIAEAVLHHLASYIGCMGFFATHYANLYDSFEKHPGVKAQRMAIEVDKESREVTFLYKLEAGRSEGSFGMNVALMCGVSEDIVNAAEIAANEFEHTSKIQQKLSARGSGSLPLGAISDALWAKDHELGELALNALIEMCK